MSHKIVNGRRDITEERGVFNVSAVYEIKPPFTPGEEFFGEITPGRMALHAITPFSTIISYYNDTDYASAETAKGSEASAREILKEQLHWISPAVNLDAIGVLSRDAESVS